MEKITANRESHWIQCLLVTCMLICGTTAAAAEKSVLIGQVTGSDIAGSEIRAVRSILESELISHPDVRLVENDAEIAVDATITRLDTNYIVILNADMSDGERRSRKYKISSFDEVDIAIKRLVAAVIEGVPVSATAERGAVFEREQQPVTRVRSVSGWEFAIGAAWPLSDSWEEKKTHYAFTLGYVWDVMDFLVELRTDFQVGYNEIDTGGITGTLGLAYVWLDARRFALFSGGELGFGRLYGDRQSRSGFALAGNTGILFLRHSDINLDLRFRLMMLADKVSGSVPVMGMLTVGLRW